MDNLNGKDIINEAITKYKEKIANAPNNTIIVQRNEQKFWNVFFRNRIDLSMFNVRVIFAGEGAVDDGGPFREFLRLSMQNLPKLSRMVFGEENQLFFTASPVDVANKCYYKLGQLSALSILTLGRGPHCFHDKLVDAIFSKNVEGVKVNDASFLETMKQIDQGNFDALFSAGIAPFDIEKAKKLYAVHYAILSRYAAITDFRSGVESISKPIIENYPYFRAFFLTSNLNVSVCNMINLFSYNFNGEAGSTRRVMEDEAMVELEFLINDLNNGVVKDLSVRDLLVFITGSDVIPPFGFQKKIDVYFEESNQLAKSSTCALNFYISCKNTRNNIEKALKMCRTLSAL